jgi:hypothetical protein
MGKHGLPGKVISAMGAANLLDSWASPKEIKKGQLPKTL